MAERLEPQGEDAMRAEILRLGKVVKALMNRAEQAMNEQTSSFGMFQNTLALEQQVRRRTRELEIALRENETMNRDLQGAKARMEQEIEEHKQTQVALEKEKEEQKVLINKLEDAHCQLLQSEKLASIGQLAAGVAHEINNPICFVNANLSSLKDYAGKLLTMLDVYESCDVLLQQDPAIATRLQQARKASDIDFVRSDIGPLIAESLEGTERVRIIVQDLRDFSRAGEAVWEWANIHTCLDSTLNVVRNEIRYTAEVVRDYGVLPQVECFPSQLNQVFMNLLVNGAQAIVGQGTITIRTGTEGNQVWVAISDTGAGIAPENMARIFDPFFTTKPVGKGTGLGLSLCYGIVERHGGRIDVRTAVGQGTTFTIWLPVQRTPLKD
ncbi:MAG: histidine kinase [Zoogloea oleivorans]|jgi:two-component system NtrC family sensor kinase|nr:histidine kinase [Zoogloea oleivorans]MDY0038308.1 histidine kinase [Zoogloea oleivorans]